MTTGQPSTEIWEEEAEVLAESLAAVLNAAEIPCQYFLYQPPNLLLLSNSFCSGVLWGQFLWSAHGVPTCHNVSDSLQFGHRDGIAR
jgi:hypothetical protein